MESVALILSIIAVVLASVAYARTGGLKDVRKQLESLGSRAGSTAEGARHVAANAIEKLESAVRGDRDEEEESAVGSSNEERKTQ